MSISTNTLDQMCELIVDCPHFTPEWTDRGFIVIRNQNIRDGCLDLSQPSYTHREDFERRIKRAKPKAGDIIFTREAPMGEVCIVPDGLECCIGQRQVLLRPRNDVDGRYLFFALRSNFVRQQIFWNEGTGSTVSNVRIPFLQALNIPRLGNEEARIGDILGALDEKIQLNRRLNETLEAMARAIFKDWFINFGPVRAKAEDLPPYLSPDLWSLFPDKLDANDKPVGWRSGRLEDVASPSGESVKPDELSPDTPYIGLEHMPRRSISLDSWEGAGKVTSGKLAFRRGDFLFGKLRPYFHKVGIAPIDGICSTDIVVLKAKEPIASAFVISCISLDEFVAYTDQSSAGTKMPRTAEIQGLTEDEAIDEQERIKRKWASVEALVGSEKRLALVADDLVRHFEDRVAALDGKAMIVCMSRRICVALYQAIVKLRPQWHSDDDETGAIKVVMTGAASDPELWQRHIGKRPKARRELIAKRAKDPKDSLKLVIVRDMWLTGFDAPCMHTMYVDKPMKGHGLMQAIARVNRVFRDKPAGLIVDYIGIAQNLKNALSQYSRSDQENTGIDEGQAVVVMLEKYEIVRDMFRPNTRTGFDYRRAVSPEATSQERLKIMACAIDWVLTMQQEAAARETSDEGKKSAHRRYGDAVLALSKAFALAAASDAAREIREEVGFFQAIRVAMVRSRANSGRSAADRELAIQQIVSRAVVSTEIVDIMKAAGIQSPDISILSDEFLAEVREIDKKNLALDALRRLINGEVRPQSKRNVVQARAFTERLEAAIARYHANAITTVQVLEELIQLAKDIRVARERGEESGLSDEEVAFYDTLAQNGSAREVMGEPHLRVIAHELVVSVKNTVTVDWMHRDAARARMRVLVKRILRKYGYPPDLQDAAVQTVLQQAEALSAEWAAAQSSS